MLYVILGIISSSGGWRLQGGAKTDYGLSEIRIRLCLINVFVLQMRYRYWSTPFSGYFFSLILAITDHKFTIDPGRDSVAQLQESCTKFRFISNASWPEPKFNRSMLITYWFIRLVSHSQHSRAHNVANRPILIDSFYWPKNKENSYIEEIQVTGEFKIKYQIIREKWTKRWWSVYICFRFTSTFVAQTFCSIINCVFFLCCSF